jgi:hypothetical protein
MMKEKNQVIHEDSTKKKSKRDEGSYLCAQEACHHTQLLVLVRKGDITGFSPDIPTRSSIVPQLLSVGTEGFLHANARVLQRCHLPACPRMAHQHREARNVVLTFPTAPPDGAYQS